MTRKHSMGTDVLEKTQYVHKNQTKIYEKKKSNNLKCNIRDKD